MVIFGNTSGEHAINVVLVSMNFTLITVKLHFILHLCKPRGFQRCVFSYYICILNKHCSILKIQIINTFFIPLFLYSKWRLDWLESLGYLGRLSWIIVCWAAKEIKDKVMYTPKAKKWWTPLSWF